MHQHPPCSVITAQEVKLQIKGCTTELRDAVTNINNQTQRTNPPEHSLTFRSTSVFTSGVRTIDNKSKNDNAHRLALLHVQRPTDAMNINSVECTRLQVLGSTGLAVEHAQWKKDLARYIGLRFHAASKVLVDARELAKAKRYELWQKAEFSFGVNPQGSFQKCFKDALTSQGKSFRSAVHATIYQPCAQQEGIMARIK